MYIEEWVLQQRLREMVEEVVEIYQSPVVEVPFTLTSEQFEIETQGMLAYKIPITRIIEMNSVKQMMEEEDRRALLEVRFDSGSSYPKRGGCF